MNDDTETKQHAVFSKVDLTAPASREFTEDERKLISFVLGINAALLQFVLEGIIPAHEQGHFMVHLQDFVYRLNAKEPLIIQGEVLPMAVDTKAGDAALEAVRTAIEKGKQEFRVGRKQPDQPVDKPRTVH